MCFLLPWETPRRDVEILAEQNGHRFSRVASEHARRENRRNTSNFICVLQRQKQSLCSTACGRCLDRHSVTRPKVHRRLPQLLGRAVLLCSCLRVITNTLFILILSNLRTCNPRGIQVPSASVKKYRVDVPTQTCFSQMHIYNIAEFANAFIPV